MSQFKDYLYGLATDRYSGLIPWLIKVFLLVLSVIYGFVVRILITFYRLKPYRLDCRVISVGNITLGGTGKTMVVEYIARSLKQQGHNVAILSRGYKRKLPSCDHMGDEPYMLSKKLAGIAIIVDADRIKAAKKAITEHKADTVILDDGFQQWKIKKDLEIVAIDATNPFGNEHLLPRGILREPLSSLKRADIFILTKTNLNPDIADIKDILAQINPRAQVFEATHQPAGLYEINNPGELIYDNRLQGKNVTLFCGIGDPDSFENLVLSLGINIALIFKFEDHHDYTRADLEKVLQDSKAKNIDTVITTEKDAVRLMGLQYAQGGIALFVLRIILGLKNEQEFHARLLRVYSA